MSALDAVGFPTRGLSPEALAERLAAWVRWPIERGEARDVERDGRRLRVHTLAVGGGSRLVTVVESRKRRFLPLDEIVCFFPAHDAVPRRELEIHEVGAPSCPWEPFATSAFPERVRFRVANPFDVTATVGCRYSGALALLAGRVEAAPASTAPMVMPASIAHQDPELPAGVFAVAGQVVSTGESRNEATGERVLTWVLSTPGGPLTVVAAARDALSRPVAGGMAVAEGEFVASLSELPR